MDVDGNSKCSCPKEWTGVFCEIDIDECSLDAPEPMCLNGASCANRDNGYVCECMTGFSGALCEINEDDCLPNPCKNGAQCVDEGGYKYVCKCPLSERGDPLFMG